jgi:carboxypeptidase Q
MNFSARIGSALLPLALLGSLCAQEVQERFRPAIQEAAEARTLEPNLRKLTDEIGGRVPGTPSNEAAVAWAEQAFKIAGADSVRIEPFAMATSWTEGDTKVTITSPVKFTVRSVSMAWSPNLNLSARVVDVGFGTPQEFAKAGNLNGAILLVHSETLKTWDDLFNEYLRATPIVETALRGHAVGIAWESSREFDILYRHINAQPGKFDRIPGVLITHEDAGRIARLLKTAQPVQMAVAMNNKLGGAIKPANVVAELRGTELPEEYVLIGAHLDSWDLGTGALDNGCDAALVIETLRSLKAAGWKPRRSIRFALFNGEEQGMLGSQAYVEAHKAEMDNVIAAVIFDTGSGKFTGYSLGGRKDIQEAVGDITVAFDRWSAMSNTTDAFVGTDNLDFLLQGVPTLVANQEPANYLINYHATSDTFDKVDFAELRKNLLIATYTVARLSEAQQHLGPRQSRAEVEQLLMETKLDEQLKLFGYWNDWIDGKRGRSKQ